MRIVVNAEPEEMEYAMGLIVEAMETFARHPERIGWGWTFGKTGQRAFFVRRTKSGFSASPAGKGAIALVSNRTERDLPVIISIEMDSVSQHGDQEDAADLVASLNQALGSDAASRLMQDGATQHTADTTAAASRLIADIETIGERHAHAVHLTAWRT